MKTRPTVRKSTASLEWEVVQVGSLARGGKRGARQQRVRPIGRPVFFGRPVQYPSLFSLSLLYPSTARATILPTLHTSFVLSLPRSPRTAWARPSEAAPALTGTRPWPVGPSERRHATLGGRYPPQRRPRRPLEPPGRRRDPRKTKDDAQDDCHAQRHTPQCTSHSARTLHPHDSARRRRLS